MIAGTDPSDRGLPRSLERDQFSRKCRDASSLVIPAQAGIQYSTADSIVYWIPACAGMTRNVLTLTDHAITPVIKG
jgi:hypothetical protein